MGIKLRESDLLNPNKIHNLPCIYAIFALFLVIDFYIVEQEHFALETTFNS